MNYNEFLQSKQKTYIASGFECEPSNKHLKPFQRAITKWALIKGKAGLFADTGHGKTIMQLSFADEVCKKTNGKVLILAPLAVSAQTKREGEKFGIPVTICRSQDDVKDGINVTNYEKLHNFDTGVFVGIVLDESSILKSYSGSVRNEIIQAFANTPYKLSCSATPSPNDYEELGNQAEFLNICTRTEMLAEYFIHDNGETQKWRIKGHAVTEFWRWVASWAMVMKNPADIGFDGTEYELPPINKIIHRVENNIEQEGFIPFVAQTLDERRNARKSSVDNRVELAAKIAQNAERCLLWCDYNDESTALKKAIAGAVEVKGSDDAEHKERALNGFSNGEINYLVSKPQICGFGMNWQLCSDMIFCGLSDSYERYYQAIRRCWRYGQTKTVNVHIIISEAEESVLKNIERKEQDAEKMAKYMKELTSEYLKCELENAKPRYNVYKPNSKIIIPQWVKEEEYE